MLSFFRSLLGGFQTPKVTLTNIKAPSAVWARRWWVRTLRHWMSEPSYGRVSRPRSEPQLQHQFADLGVQGLDVDFRCRRFGAATALKHIGSACKELLLPRGDLIGMHVELLSKLRNRSIVPQGSQGHLRLEGRCVVPAGSLLHLRS